ncbi:MAG: MoaD/ThiS family protein [Deltaproteobacteria bacterium]|nr:MoaD/ThiS family protein [Deltaproteobacteria bacterium]
MKIKLRFFSLLHHYFGTGEMETNLDSPKTVQEVFFDLFEDKELAEKLARSIRFAVNWEYVEPEMVVHEGDEVAFIPPVSGG